MLEVKNIQKSFGEPAVQVLFDINFKIQNKEFVSITGRSGSGKSTLLYILSTLDQPSRGQVLFDGTDVTTLKEQEIHEFRNKKMGFIFQFHYLLPELTALENVLMPARRTGQHISRQKRGQDLLAEFGLAQKMDRLPKHLSGGEQQRVAIARSLIMEPQYVFADEPTGNLDSANGDIVMGILKKATSDFGASVIYVTHDADFAGLANHKIQLHDGRITLNE